MSESDEHTQKILDIVFDENISEILAEMESSPKKCEFLAEKFQLTPNDLDQNYHFLYNMSLLARLVLILKQNIL